MSIVYSDPVIQLLQQHLSSQAYKYPTFPKFVFLCGKGYKTGPNNTFEETNRGIFKKYINKSYQDVFTILSEEVWEQSFLGEIDLLTFEEFLAEVSDRIVLFVESMGSACELGAFAVASDPFLKKLLIVLDKQYQKDTSFINQGPIHKVEKKATIIHADLNGALLSSKDIRASLNSLEKSKKQKINKSSGDTYIYSFILEILELINILEPINKDDLINVYKNIKNIKNFTFIKSSNNEKFSKVIYPRYIFDLLLKVELVEYDDKAYTYSIKNRNHKVDFMFNLSNITFNKIRNKILARKYKYKMV